MASATTNAPVALGPATKKPGPNDKCSCGSELKAKKCCFGPGTPDKLAANHTPIASDCQGKINSGKPEELHEQAKEAVRARDDTKAAHFYTMAIDVIAKGMKRDSNGIARDADLVAVNKSSNGLLSELLSGRSSVYLRQKDIVAALEDAETCTRANPEYEKGHLRLAVAYESAGVSLVQQLDAIERGLESCPHSEVLVTRKWRLKKAIAEQGNVSEPTAQGYGSNKPAEPWGIEQTRRLANDSSDSRHAMAATDLGRTLAAGAHGLEKDLKEAARYLRIGVKGGDLSAQRDLGCLLLDLGEPVEASEHLKLAADAGDEEAAGFLQQLATEAKERENEARAQLEKFAAMGDPRAIQILEEMRA